MAKFGVMLRDAREIAGRSMGELARHLDVSVPYLSDVERGFRPPLVDDRIMKAAAFLGASPDPLLKAAAEARGAFQLSAAVNPTARQVGAMLSRQWNADDGLSQSKLKRIREVLEEAES